MNIVVDEKITSRSIKKNKSLTQFNQPAFQDIGIQTDIIERDYMPTKVLRLFYIDSEAFPKWLTKSHTIFVLLSGLLLLIIYLQNYTMDLGDNSLINNAKMGYFAAMFAIVIFGTLYLPNSLLQRPHPAVWRLVQSAGICYFITMVFACLFQRDDLQKFLQLIVDPNLGKPLPEKSYADDCRIYTPEHPESAFYNVVDRIDIFVSAHFFGWMVKMLIVRDFWLCMFQSMIFEVFEVTFRHWLPNFWECWWDHVFLDLLICNTGGIIAGVYFIDVMKMKQFKWSLQTDSKKKSFYQNIKELVITPNLENHQWQVFSSTKRFLQVVWFIIFMNFLDLSYFFNKFILWIRPSHPICQFRTFILGFLCMPAAREYYEYISNSFGPNVWLIKAIIGAEIILFYRNYNGVFIEPFPQYVKIMWSIFGILFCCILGLLIYKDIFKSSKKVNPNKLKNLHIKNK